jgi:hypothetical protein
MNVSRSSVSYKDENPSYTEVPEFKDLDMRKNSLVQQPVTISLFLLSFTIEGPLKLQYGQSDSNSPGPFGNSKFFEQKQVT